MSQGNHNLRTKNFLGLVDELVDELGKVDGQGREGVEWELSYWTKAIFPLLQTIQKIVNNDLNKYWQMLSFLSTIDALVKPAQKNKTQELFYILSKLPQYKANFILGQINGIISTQLEEIQLFLSKKEKDGFIKALRQTNYESICPQCWVLRSYFYIETCLKEDEKNRKELLSKAYEKGLVSSTEQNVSDEVYNKIVDCHNHFYCRYASDKRYFDGVVANILLAIALTLRQESYDYFLVYMHKMGVKIYCCVTWLFLEREDRLSKKDHDAIYTILHDSHPKDYSYISKDYFQCDVQTELDECKSRYCEILDINNHSTTYSYLGEEGLLGKYSHYKMPRLNNLSRYELGISGMKWFTMMEGYLDVSYVIPKEELVIAQRQLEDALSFDGKCFLIPFESNGDPIPQESQPEQVFPSDSSDQDIPHKLTKEEKDIIGDFDISPNYFKHEPSASKDHCTITNEKFNAIDAVKKAKMFENFIKLLAREYCIDPDKTTMKSFAYAFTGIGFKSYRGFHVQPAYWKKEKVDILLFICTKFYKRNEDTSTNFQKAVEVFHVTADGNLSTRAKSIKGTRFDTKFKECFGEL